MSLGRGLVCDAAGVSINGTLSLAVCVGSMFTVLLMSSGATCAYIFVMTKKAALITVNQDYIELAENWLHFAQLCWSGPVFVGCTDKLSWNHFTGQGQKCLPLIPHDNLSHLTKTMIGSQFDNDHATWTAMIRFQILPELLQQYHEVIYSDVDAIWIRSPWRDIQRRHGHLCFQTGGWPSDLAAKWGGFTFCTGFFYVQRKPALLDLMRDTCQEFSKWHDDQLAINYCLDRHIQWQDRYQGDYLGCRVVALPSGSYERSVEPQRDMIVWHPITAKSQNIKREHFRSHGYWYK